MVLAHDINKGNRTNDIKITENITFETMLLAPSTIQGLKDSGFHKPSPIQLYGIPIGKCGFDLLLEAKSGTGKTAVFAIIALEKLDLYKGLQVIILTPTREIASQTCDVLKQIGSRYKDLQVEVVMGGLPIQHDIEKFQRPVHIVVGSPGRLRHLIHSKCVDIKSVRLLVLDEADKLMETSFQPDIKFIYSSLPKQKQVIMSSATYPPKARDLINNYLQNASHICPDSDCILLGIEQKVTFVKYNDNIIRHTQDRFKELNKILRQLQFKQCLVFCNYQVRVTEIHKLLQKAEWPSEKLYAQQEQLDRLDALRTLQQYKCRVLVSTDLAARGIDASNIDLVINYEPPYDWQTYLHRIGRAGRFGSYGLAITILNDGKEQQKFKEMFKAMEISINIRHVWSDKKFDITSSAPNTPPPELRTSLCELNNPTTTNLVETEEDSLSSEDMWDLLSSKSNDMNFIEPFETLFQLKENPESLEIEPFSELMHSLQKNNQKTNEDVEFKHIKMKKTSISQNFGTDKDNKDLRESYDKNIGCDIYEERKEYTSFTPDVSKNTNGDIKDSATIKDKIKRNDKNITDINEKRPELQVVSSDVSENVNNKGNAKEDKNKNISLDNIEYRKESRTIMTDLSENNIKTDKSHNSIETPLDLPITFSSSKHQTYDTIRKFNKTEHKIYSNNVNKNKVSRIKNLQPHWEDNSEILSINNDTDNKQRELNKKQTIKVNNNYDETYKNYENEHKTSNQRQQRNVSDTRNFTFQSCVEQDEREKLYGNWYNQLKIRMKQIEQAIYIDTMSTF